MYYCMCKRQMALKEVMNNIVFSGDLTVTMAGRLTYTLFLICGVFFFLVARGEVIDL